MIPDNETPLVVLKHAIGAGLSGMVVRIVLALHGGVRSWVLLLIEGMLGAVIGFCVGALAAYFDPSLRNAGWGFLFVMGVAGMASALGTRLFDLIARAVEKRLIG